MLIIKQTEQGYKVKHLFSEMSDVTYEDYGRHWSCAAYAVTNQSMKTN